MKPASKNGKRMQEQIMEKIRSRFANEGYKLNEDGEGPTLVTVVNASANARADIRRDMTAANLSGISVIPYISTKTDSI